VGVAVRRVEGLDVKEGEEGLLGAAGLLQGHASVL